MSDFEMVIIILGVGVYVSYLLHLLRKKESEILYLRRLLGEYNEQIVGLETDYRRHLSRLSELLGIEPPQGRNKDESSHS